MNLNKKVIHLTIILTIISLLAIFIISSIKYYKKEFIYYDLLLTVSGGIFTSTLIVLIFEIQKYFNNKRKNEDQLFHNMIYIYSNLLVMKNVLNETISNPKKQVILNSLTYRKDFILGKLNQIQIIEYSTFCKKHILYQAFQEFLRNLGKIDYILNNTLYFDIAINSDMIEKVEQNQRLENIVNGYDKNICAVTKKLNDQFAEIIFICEDFISKIDYSKRYDWDKNQISQQEKEKIFSKEYSIEDFLRE